MGKITLWVKINIILFLFGFTSQLYSFNSISNNFNENYIEGICYVFADAPEIDNSNSYFEKKYRSQNKTADLNISYTKTEATCSDKPDGSIKATISGGQSPYTYEWTGGGVSATTNTISNVKPGNYTLKITDANQETKTETVSLTFNDSQIPNVLIKDITVQLEVNGSVNISASNIDNGSTDNCGIKTISLSKTSFNCSNVGSNTVTFTVTDVNDNTATKSAIVTVEDKIAPNVITKNITIQLDASGNATIAEDAVNNGSSDACGSLSFDTNITSFDCSKVGNNTVELTVTDVNGNSAKKTAIVTVEDKIAPNVITKNITVQLDASGNATIAQDAVNNGSSDACGGLSFVTNITSFDCSKIGNNTVELTVTDVNGNSAKKTALVTIEDKIAPNVITKNITVQLDASGNTTIAEDAVNNGTSDACGGLSFVTNITSFDCTNVGNNTVELTVTDANGNSAKKTATVTVEDTINPIIPTIPDNENWSCNTAITNFPTTTDNCNSVITGTTTDPIQFNTFGEYTINWVFTDPSGNSVTAPQIVIIPEPTVDLPVISGNEYCNESLVPAIVFSGNNLANKKYEWSYKSDTGSSIDIGLPTSGTGNIPEFTARNNGSEIITAVFTVVPFGNSCEGVPITFTIKINPTPTITKPADVVVCAGETVEKINFPGASVSGTQKEWTNDNPAIGLFQTSGNGAIQSFTATNTTAESIFANITLTPSANNCEGISETFKIEVKPRPEITNPPVDKTYCNGITTESIPLESNVSGTTFTISGGSSIGLANRTNVTEIPSYMAKVGTATITITPITNGCQGNPKTYTVLVNPTPTLSVNPANQAICSGSATAINLSGSGQSYSWTLAEVGSNITGASEGSGNIIAQTLNNSGTQSQVVKYKITPEANGCTGTPIIVIVTVNPIPQFEITIPECQPSVDLTNPAIKNSTFNGLTYTYWNNPEATSQLQNPTTVGLGTYYVKGTASSGCSLVKELIIENIQPVLTSTLTPADICSNTVFNYTPESNIDGTIYSWTRAAVAGISNPENSSTDENQNNPNEILNNITTNSIQVAYTYTLTSPNGCTNEQQVKVNVKPTPMLQQQNYTNELCSGDLFEYTPQSTLGGTSYRWERRDANGNIQSSGTGAINERLNNDTENNIVFTYYFTLSNSSCENAEEFRVPVTILPTFQVEASASRIEICPGESIDLFSSTELSQDLNEILLFEDFNSGINWTPNNAGAATWSRQNSYNPPEGGGTVNSRSGGFAVSNKFNLTGNSGIKESTLTSPSFSTRGGYTSINLNFKHFYRDVSNNWGDFAVIEYSLNNGSWNLYTFFNTTQGSPGNFEGFDREISELIGYDQVRIRFRFLNQGDNARAYTWAIDDIKITGEIQSAPEVEWTSSTDENWTSNEQNPTNITPGGTTVYTVKYTDPDLECPGRASVEVVVRQPTTPTITANYCGNSQFIELVSDNEYQSYVWEAGGEVLGSGKTLDVEIAQTYTLTVIDQFGCTGTASINVSKELIENGDFENGVYSFYTDYRNRTTNNPDGNSLRPEGDFAVDRNAADYHTDFAGRDHTTGNGKFLIVNGAPGSGKVIWRQTITDIQPNTNYYFNAWGMNVNPKTPARLQFKVNGQSTGTVADLRGKPVGQWVKFYSNPFWNSGNATSAVLEIINLETIRDGNDFGLDDISFGTLEPIVFSIDPQNNSMICEGETLELYANIEGGRYPITFEWTGPSGSNFSNKTTVNNFEELNEAITLEIPEFTAEMAGTYTLKVTDFYGCNAKSGSTEVKILEINAGEDQTICSNIETIQLNGEIFGTTAGATWSGGNGSFSDNTALDAIYTPTENEFITGSVELTLTSNDPNAVCSDQVLLTFNNAPLIEITITPNTCFGANDGTASVTINEGSGTAPFTYIWEDEAGTVIQTTQTATGLAPNANGYTVTVTDANGCATTLISDPIEEPIILEILEISNTNVTCFGGDNGTARLEVTGGFIAPETPLYVLSLLDPEGNDVVVESSNTTGILLVENLAAGVYTFTANTANGCNLLSENVIIDQPLEIIVEAGEDIRFSECGITQVSLNATLVDPELGSGRWEIISSTGTGNGTFQDSLKHNTTFIGESGATYELGWIVTPIIEECTEITDSITIVLPESCSKLNFDGIDDYIDAGDQYAMAGSDFSVEAWVKSNAISGVNTILSKRIAEDSNLGYDLFLNNGAPSFRVRNKTVTSTKTIGTDRWYHISAVYTSTKISLYVDGIEVQNNTNNIPNGTGNFSAPFLIGATHAPTEVKLTKQHFNGFIEEVRVWKRPISQNQIRFFMNQRIQKNGTVAEGEVLTKALNLPNSPALPDWSSLEGYYQLLAKDNLISSGKTPNLGSTGNVADGLLKNIQLMQENTAPLPYILNSNNANWFEKSTWRLPTTFNGLAINRVDVWNAPGSKGINGDVIGWNIVKLNGKSVNNIAGNNIQLLALLDETGNLNMKGNNQSNGSGLTITHYLKLDGKIDLNGESQLIQTEGSILAGTGSLERDQQGTSSSFNYNYWSSPVLPNSGSNSYTVKTVMFDGSSVGTNAFKTISFSRPHTYADGPKSNPIKISDYWINAFRAREADAYSQWEQIGSTVPLKPGEGYTMKGTEDIDISAGKLQNYTFSGFPNNGDISLNIGTEQNYLIGNPYPSAIDAKKFIQDNLKTTSGGNNTEGNIFNGAIYFWDHFAGKTHNLAEYVGGYATYNLIGGVRAIATDDRINSNTGETTNKIPGQYIPVGQGFFINSALDIKNGANVTIHGGKVVFKNSQRIFNPETNSSSQFLRPEIVQEKSKTVTPDAKIRLDFSSPLGYHRQILVGTSPNATNGFDLGYDAPLNDYNVEDFFWLINNYEYVIQGVANFDPEQILPIGMLISKKGEITIEINELENVPDDITIYLKDLEKGTFHDLRKGAFKIEIAPGGHYERFQIVFKLDEEVVDPDEENEEEEEEEEENPDVDEDGDGIVDPTLNPDLETTLDVIYAAKNRELTIINPDNLEIKKVVIYNLVGQKIQEFVDMETKQIMPMIVKEFPAAVYVVKMYSEKGEMSKNIIQLK